MSTKAGLNESFTLEDARQFYLSMWEYSSIRMGAVCHNVLTKQVYLHLRYFVVVSKARRISAFAVNFNFSNTSQCDF